MKAGFKYELLHQDKHCGARLGRLTTPRGLIDLPTFMPVGTCGTVKGLTTGLLNETGAQIILGNTYHLHLRPGSDIVQQMGGLPKFMGWNKPMLTDSGGFQVFSLAKLTKITEEGAKFRSHIDGSLIDLTPEISVKIQENLGADIAMVFDHVIELPNARSAVKDAMDRTIRWAKRCKDAHSLDSQVQFAIVQGGLDEGLRQECCKELIELDFPGYAIGGLSVGEPPEEMYRILDGTTPMLPEDKPRYLMGVGLPENLIECIALGIDMFDCVLPTRNARHGMLYTWQGIMNIKNEKWKTDFSTIDPLSTSTMSKRYTKAYLRHLFQVKEILGCQIASVHNLAFYLDLMRVTREKIKEGVFSTWKDEVLPLLRKRL
jgi:queuine tRNA-ribosyltransferase